MMEYYSAVKRKKFLTHAITWLILDIMLSEIRQLEKDVRYSYNNQVHRDGKQNGGRWAG